MYGWFGFVPAFAGAACGAKAGCASPKAKHRADGHSYMRGHGEDGGGFGVRRPLRFMARNLNLSDAQANRMAGILDTLRTERAQADVDHRRAIGVFADAFTQDAFDEAKIQEATELRARSASQVQQAVVVALRETFDLLDAEQRLELAYLLRSGALTI